MACGRWVLSEADNPPSHFDSKSLNHNIAKFNFKLSCLENSLFSRARYFTLTITTAAAVHEQLQLFR